jgi:hypothetical protein
MAGYPAATETAQSLYLENIDLQRAMLAFQERFRARDKVPTIAITGGANLGTSPPAPALSADASDMGGKVTIQTGTGSPGAGDAVDITFSSARDQAPSMVLLFAANGLAAANAPQFFVNPAKVTATKFTISMNVAPAASGTWVFYYLVIP